MRNYINQFKESPLYAGSILISTWSLAIVSFALASFSQAMTSAATVLCKLAARLQGKEDGIALFKSSGYEVAMSAVGIVLPSTSPAEQWLNGSLEKDQVDQSDAATTVEEEPVSSSGQGDSESKPTPIRPLSDHDVLGKFKD